MLQTAGRWTPEGCDSRFLTDTDARTYLFRLVEDGQVRIDLTFAEGDSYLHLMTADGSPIAHDEADEEISFHGTWQEFEMLSGCVFGPVTVMVEGGSYQVLALDAEMRAALPAYGLANDAVLCEAEAAGPENRQFL